MHTKGDFLIALNLFLHRAYQNGKNVVVIVDEAQRLSDELLEEIRLLSNIERPDQKLINIVLVGQNELKEKLAKNPNRALRQRITAFAALGPLDPNEVAGVIRHRLKVAGTAAELFTPEATRMIIDHSRGNPRLINSICDMALMTAFVQERHRVDEVIIRQCVGRLTYLLAPAVKADPGAAIHGGPSGPGADRLQPIQKNHDSQEDGAIPPTPPALPASRRRAWPAGVAIGVLVLLVLGIFYVYHPGGPDQVIRGQAPPQRIQPQQVSSPDQTGDAAPVVSPVGSTAHSESSAQATAGLPDKATPPTPPADRHGAQPGPVAAVVGGRQAATENTVPATPSRETAPESDGDVEGQGLCAETAPGQATDLPPKKTVIHFPYNSNQISDDAFRQLDLTQAASGLLARRISSAVTGIPSGCGSRGPRPRRQFTARPTAPGARARRSAARRRPSPTPTAAGRGASSRRTGSRRGPSPGRWTGGPPG